MTHESTINADLCRCLSVGQDGTDDAAAVPRYSDSVSVSAQIDSKLQSQAATVSDSLI